MRRKQDGMPYNLNKPGQEYRSREPRNPCRECTVSSDRAKAAESLSLRCGRLDNNFTVRKK